MSRPRVPFYKDDVKRAVAGVIAAGMKPGRVEIDGGKISVFAVDASAPTPRTSSISGRRSKMRVRLKGLNRVRVRLADGTVAEYYYAGKGGPRLTGEFGSPEFIASYHAAVTARKAPPPGTILSLLQGFQASDRDFLSKAPRTRADYIKQIKIIERQFGDFPLKALTDPRTRGEFMAWRDRLALRSRRQADYAWTVLARVLSWAKDRGLTTVNPCERGGRLYRGSRADKVWSHDDEAAFYASAPPHLHLPLLLALWTGQREGDLLRMTWHCYDGQRIRLQQSKTGARVVIKVGAPLKAALDAIEKRGDRILLNSRGKPWNEDGFRSSFNKARKRAGIEGVTFNDLRGTAVTRLALADASVPEIATITGHSLRDVQAILDAHYLHRDPALGDSAMMKREAYEARKVNKDSQMSVQTVSFVLQRKGEKG